MISFNLARPGDDDASRRGEASADVSDVVADLSVLDGEFAGIVNAATGLQDASRPVTWMLLNAAINEDRLFAEKQPIPELRAVPQALVCSSTRCHSLKLLRFCLRHS